MLNRKNWLIASGKPGKTASPSLISTIVTLCGCAGYGYADVSKEHENRTMRNYLTTRKISVQLLVGLTSILFDPSADDGCTDYSILIRLSLATSGQDSSY